MLKYLLTVIIVIIAPMCGKINSLELRRSSLFRPSQAHCGDKTGNAVPWLALLEHESPDATLRSFSNGFLISSKHVLTSVSSIYNAGENWKLSNVRLNSTPAFGPNQLSGNVHQIESIIMHDSQDLAIIVLNQTTNFTNTLKPICLPESNRFFLSDATFLTSLCKRMFVGESADEKLTEQTTVSSPEAIFLADDVCKAMYKRAGGDMSYGQLCAWDERGDNCVGDYGGPFMTIKHDKYFAIGISSYLNTKVDLPKNVYPSVYTSIIKNYDWIVNHIKETP